MSFRDTLNRIKKLNSRVKIAEGEEVSTEERDRLAREFIAKCADYGLALTEEDLKFAEETKEGKITPYKFLTSPGWGSQFIEEVMSVKADRAAGKTDTQVAADMVVNKLKEINEVFGNQGYHKWFSAVSDAKLKELEVMLPRMKRRGHTGAQSIGLYIYDGLHAFMGDSVIKTNSNELDEELEKMASSLVKEFETKVRSLLKGFKKN